MQSSRGVAAAHLASAIHERARTAATNSAVRSWPGQDRECGPVGTVRRKYLINKARRMAERYGLQEQLLGWVYNAGREAITGLAIGDLDALVSWLVVAGDNIETVCDRSDLPPAR